MCVIALGMTVVHPGISQSGGGLCTFNAYLIMVYHGSEKLFVKITALTVFLDFCLKKATFVL